MNTIQDIIDFINGWREAHNFGVDEILTDEQITKFVGELQEKISLMKYSIPENVTIIGYSGMSNGERIFEIVDQAVVDSNGKAFYISNLDAGKLLNHRKFKTALSTLLLNDQEAYNMITSGCDSAWNRIGPKCGYGDYLSLDDFISSKLMGESVGVSDNIIVFAPEELNPNKVFCTTEIERIFANDTFKFINGIPKEELSALYFSGEEGRRAVFQIISRTSREVVGTTAGLEEQAVLLETAFGKNGILNSASCDFSINMCYDIHGNQLGVELFSKRSGTSLLSDYASGNCLVNGSDSGVALKLDYSNWMKASELLGKSDIAKAIADSSVYLGEDGSIIGRSFRGTALEGYVEDVIPPKFDVIYQTSYEVYSKLADDAAMVERWGADYESLSAVERYQLKEIDYLLRMTAGAVEPDALALTTLDYLKGSGKTLEELTDIDRALINFCSNKNLQNSNAFRFLNSIEPSENLIKVIKGAGTLATVGIAAYTVWDTVSRANKAIENDRPHEAAGIVIGSWCKLGITLLYGEELTGALAPYFAGAGMAIGGPVGAVIGGILAGVVGFGFAALFGEAIDGAIEDLWGYMDDLYFYAGLAIVYDPLALDLDGDGFELLSVKDGVYFDEDAKGLTEKTEWISSDDALLAIDLNGDGIINDGSELFGTSTLLADGTRAENGFAALAQYDENQDGRIDAQDAVFSQLTVWQDVNSDGISQQDELFSLQELGITGISLDASEEDGIRVAQVELENGTSIKIGEFDFDAQHYNTIEKNPIEITDEISEMPDIKAIGNVASLHTLMQSDETGTLKTYVCQFAESDSREEKEELLTKILYFITGADQVASDSRGGRIDAKKLTVIEQFMGKDYVGTGGANPVNTAAPILEEIYFDIYQAYYSMLNAQTQLKDYMKMVVWTEDEDGRTYLNTELFQEFVSLCAEQGFDMTEEIAEMGRFISSVNKTNPKNFQNYFMTYADNDVYAKAIADVCCRNPYIGTETNNTYTGSISNDIVLGGAGNDTLNGYAQNDILYGEEGDDKLSGGNGDDLLVGGAGDDTLYGDAGDDRLYGGTGEDNLNGGVGDDILIGGTGNDTLYGETGNDTYVFHRGDGEDIIFDYGSSETSGTDDKILFGEGIAPEDVRVERVGNNLVIDYGEGDRITVKDMYYFADGRSVIENIEFSDGTKWTHEEIQRRAAIHYGTDGADSIQGYTTVAGYGQDETFIGGAGNDRFYGYGGNDTYIFHRGDGIDTISDTEGEQDRIVFGEGITPEDVHVERVGSNLVIDYGEGDRVTVADAYRYADGRCLVENIEFADGTKWGPEEISVRAAVLHGTDGTDTMKGYAEVPGYSQNETFYAGEGNDTVYGYAGDDILYGEAGDDNLNGGAGDDILNGGTGNDTLYGETGNDTYVFHRGDGEDIIFDYGSSETSGTDDEILFGEGIAPEDVRVERVGNNLVIDYGEGDRITVKDMYYFADGRSVIENIEFSDGTKWTHEEIQRRAAIHYGTDGADSIQGYTAVVGYSQDETFIGGAGNDRFYGYGGNDTYIFQRGDGIDTISDTEISETEGKQDRIVFGEGITPEDVHVERVGSNLVIDYGEGDRVTVTDAYRYADGRCLVENIEFADGIKWGPEEISVRAAVLHGTDGADTMKGYGEVPGYSQNETFYAGDGNDTVYGYAGDDILYGEAGDDNLNGGAGDDILIGGTGNDTLNGETGNDTYVFHRGDGEDIIFDYGSSETSGKDDKILFGEGITREDVHMERVGNNLVIDYGEGDRITVKDAYYFADGRTVIENMEFSDGTRYDIDYENRTLNAQHNVSAAINEMVDSCVEKMEDLYAGRSSMDAGADEPKNFGIDEGVAIGDYTEADIDHMVNLLVQDMSEQRTDAISDSDIFTDRSTDTVKVQLWSES